MAATHAANRAPAYAPLGYRFPGRAPLDAPAACKAAIRNFFQLNAYVVYDIPYMQWLLRELALASFRGLGRADFVEMGPWGTQS